MPTKQDYMQIINDKISERAEPQEKSEKTSVDGTGENEGGVDGISTKKEYK
jgi:hypothetical protein